MKNGANTNVKYASFHFGYCTPGPSQWSVTYIDVSSSTINGEKKNVNKLSFSSTFYSSSLLLFEQIIWIEWNKINMNRQRVYCNRFWADNTIGHHHWWLRERKYDRMCAIERKKTLQFFFTFFLASFFINCWMK